MPDSFVRRFEEESPEVTVTVIQNIYVYPKPAAMEMLAGRNRKVGDAATNLTLHDQYDWMLYHKSKPVVKENQLKIDTSWEEENPLEEPASCKGLVANWNVTK